METGLFLGRWGSSDQAAARSWFWLATISLFTLQGKRQFGNLGFWRKKKQQHNYLSMN